MTHATGGKGLVVVVHWISFIFHHKLLQVRTHKKINCDQQKFGGKKNMNPPAKNSVLKCCREKETRPWSRVRAGGSSARAHAGQNWRRCALPGNIEARPHIHTHHLVMGSLISQSSARTMAACFLNIILFLSTRVYYYYYHSPLSLAR